MYRILVATLLFSILLPSTLLAAGPGTDSPLIPYHGYLESDGNPAMGLYDFRIALYTAAGEVATGLATDLENELSEGAWSDEFVDIDVVAGEFSILLGSISPLEDKTFSENPELYFAIAVRPALSGNYTLLEGKQRLLQVPFAVLPENELLGTVFVRKNDHSIILRDAGIAINHATYGGEGLAISHGENDTLVLNDSNDFGGRTVIQSDTIVTGDLTTQGNIIAENNVEVHGTVRWKCPPDMERIGTWCIDKVGHAADDWEDAFGVCNGEYKTICPMEVYMQCDSIHPSYTAQDSSCGDWTDEDSTAANEDLWSQDIAAYVTTGDKIFDSIATYDGEGNYFNVEAVRDSSGNLRYNRYFCCIPGYFH
ncbi:hypothetical protein KAI87_04765 [Myxococcota bacterium]|nr:hypothetical protein [Myxococcota bacterium]